jgi:hypothetical protein
MEPATLQYFQQGVMKKLYKFIGLHPYLGRRVQLSDQTQNQKMALQGSITNDVSTIDLSAASDSVSWSLVKAVFAHTPLLKWLYATRSKKTLLPNGEKLTMLKYAPMGSALCFPVQCIIYAALIEYVSQKWCNTNRQAKPDYSVFGDDLVINRKITKEVIEGLTSLGFLVNENKSFTNGPFRESCGKDYYEGVDVSSVYYRLPAFKVDNLSPEVFASLCSSANLAQEKGLLWLRKYYLSILLCKKHNTPYFTNTTSQSPAVYSPQPTNYHSGRKWNKDYQCWQGKFCSVQSVPRVLELPANDQLGLFVKLAQFDPDENFVKDNRVRVTGTGNTLHGACVRLGYMYREVDAVTL